jgi:hypothetical protein
LPLCKGDTHNSRSVTVVFDTAHLPNMRNLSLTIEDCRAGTNESDEKVK